MWAVRYFDYALATLGSIERRSLDAKAKGGEMPRTKKHRGDGEIYNYTIIIYFRKLYSYQRANFILQPSMVLCESASLYVSVTDYVVADSSSSGDKHYSKCMVPEAIINYYTFLVKIQTL